MHKHRKQSQTKDAHSTPNMFTPQDIRALKSRRFSPMEVFKECIIVSIVILFAIVLINMAVWFAVESVNYERRLDALQVMEYRKGCATDCLSPG